VSLVDSRLLIYFTSFKTEISGVELFFDWGFVFVCVWLAVSIFYSTLVVFYGVVFESPSFRLLVFFFFLLVGCFVGGWVFFFLERANGTYFCPQPRPPPSPLRLFPLHPLSPPMKFLSPHPLRVTSNLASIFPGRNLKKLPLPDPDQDALERIFHPLSDRFRHYTYVAFFPNVSEPSLDFYHIPGSWGESVV